MKRLLMILGIIFSIVGIVCFVLCIVQEGKNQILLISGLTCNALGLVVWCILQRLNVKK